MRITGRKKKFRDRCGLSKKGQVKPSTKPGFSAQNRIERLTERAVVEECGHGWPLLESGEAMSPQLIPGCGPMRSRTDRTNEPKRKWPKELPLGEHTSLGPKSYCPDYRNLPVT
jgi:hypothetical protein